MSSWELHVEEVNAILSTARTQAAQVPAVASDELFGRIAEGIRPTTAAGYNLNSVTGAVAAAVDGLLEDQKADVVKIFDHLEAAIWGADAASVELQNADQEMAARAVDAATRAGVEGHFEAFAPYGWREEP